MKIILAIATGYILCMAQMTYAATNKDDGYVAFQIPMDENIKVVRR